MKKYFIIKKRFILLALLFVLPVIVFFVCCSSFLNREPAEQDWVPLPVSKSYADFIESWNQYAKNYPAEYQFFGSNAASYEILLKTLQDWCKVFAQRPSQQYLDELKSLAENVAPTSFHAYEEFRKKHYQESHLELSEYMDNRQLAISLNSYVGIGSKKNPVDYISKDTVKTIVFMNNFCQFFLSEKVNLHRKNIDRNINNCTDLSTNGDYPALDELICN